MVAADLYSVKPPASLWGSRVDRLMGYIEIVKGLGAKNVLTESFDRNVLAGAVAIDGLGRSSEAMTSNFYLFLS